MWKIYGAFTWTELRQIYQARVLSNLNPKLQINLPGHTHTCEREAKDFDPSTRRTQPKGWCWDGPTEPVINTRFINENRRTKLLLLAKSTTERWFDSKQINKAFEASTGNWSKPTNENESRMDLHTPNPVSKKRQRSGAANDFTHVLSLLHYLPFERLHSEQRRCHRDNRASKHVDMRWRRVSREKPKQYTIVKRKRSHRHRHSGRIPVKTRLRLGCLQGSG